MNTKELLIEQTKKAYQKLEQTEQLVKFKPAIGTLSTARTVAQEWRLAAGLVKKFEIRLDHKEGFVLLVPLEASTKTHVVQAPVQDSGEPVRTQAVLNVLSTEGRITKPVLDALIVLFDNKIISACEFTKSQMPEFDLAASDEHRKKFLVSTTKKGILIV